MNNHKTHSLARALRTSAQLFSTAFAFAIAATAAFAQSAAVTGTDTTVQLEAYVVSASRTQQNIKLTPSSVTSLPLSEMERIQIPDLRTALQLVPGVTITETGGGSGSQSAVNIRGAGTRQTLFIIDGIRMNAEDATSSYTSYLGSAGLAGLDRVEILRGPQSTLYGSAAMGGVVSMETARGAGSPRGSLSIDGGSFNSIGAFAGVSGKSPLANNLSSDPQSLNYSAALSASYTDNDRDTNTAKKFSGSTRIEYQLADRITAGFTYRGARSNYEEPGSVTSNYPSTLDVNIDLATLYAGWKPVANFDTRLTYGWIQNIYDLASIPSGVRTSYMHSTRNVLDWQNTWQALEQLQIVAGLNGEWSIYDYDNQNVDYSERLASVYLNAVANPVENLELTAGVRGDDYSTFDSHATWRAGASYRIEQTKTTIRATYGTGFNAPSPQYVYGGGYYVASPGLKPEKSKGWDLGIEQDLWRDLITVGATYFRNDFDDKFGYAYNSSWKTLTYNIPGATTKGLETYLYARPVKGMNVQVNYTYLDTRDNTGARLPRLPRHTMGANINYQFTKELLVGAGLNWTGGRSLDSIYTPVTLPDYTTVRLYGAYEICQSLKLKLRFENIFDKKYDAVAGYPGLPFGVFGGIEWKF